MLANVIGNYIDTLREREFDAPFIALLQCEGFYDIHFLHGSFEFGKDFIAKQKVNGEAHQYAFQTKAGNINLAIWNESRGQIDMLRTNPLAHPNFDSTMPREVVFVITGRLTGAAPLAAQSYRDHLNSLKEVSFTTWDRETLVEKLAISPSTLTSAPAALLTVIGSETSELLFDDLELYSRSWISSTPGPFHLRYCLEMAVIANHCRREDRLDLACYLPLMLLRAVFASEHFNATLSVAGLEALEAAKQVFAFYAGTLWQTCVGKFLDKDGIFTGRFFTTLVAYPVRCAIIVELLGLLALSSSDAKSAEIAQYISDFIIANPGSGHPISDRWAVSLIAPMITLMKHGHTDRAKQWCRNSVIWVANHYEGADLGLSGPHATPTEEARRLLGSSFDFTLDERRSESFLAAILLDLCAVFNFKDLYSDAVNDFRAVGAMASVISTPDNLAQYGAHLTGASLEANVTYSDVIDETKSVLVAPHHANLSSRYYPTRVDSSWSQIAITSVARDRYVVSVFSDLL